MTRRYLSIFTATVLLLCVRNSIGTVTYVNSGGSIQSAIGAATHGDTIIVAEGTYYENINFLGKAIVLRSTDPNDSEIVEATIIQAASGTDSVILLENSEEPNTVIDGFTIQGGGYAFGAGILCNNAGCTISNCVITNNNSPNRGGAIYCQNGDGLYITNCDIKNNSTVNMGGGIYVSNTPVTITNSTFSNNTGGALYFYNGTEATITNSIFDQNPSVNYSGGITSHNSQIKIKNSRFTGNESDNYGGAIYLNNSDGYLQDCIITGNRSRKGGGIYCEGGSSPELINCVLAGNYASDTGDYGGGLHCINSSNPDVRNSIFWLNRPTQVATSYAYPVIKYCLLQGGWGTALDHNIDAELGNPFKPGPDFILQGQWDDNGTPEDTTDDSWTEIIDFTDPDAYHIDVYSPCVDTGDPNFMPELDQTDIDGDYRVLGFNVDMGIDETLDPIDETTQRRVYNVTQDLWYETIQDALDGAASPGVAPYDEILVNPGRYEQNINFNGKAVTLTSRYDDNIAFIDATAIDGKQSGSTVLFETSEDPNSIIQGFTITNGSGTNGGGIYCYDSGPIIKHCTITNNNSTNGGGVGVNNAQPSISHCIIKNNTASQNGGALALSGTTNITVHNCAIVANSAATAGGGIYCDSSAACAVQFCTIKDNNYYGLYYDGDVIGNVTFENTILWNNQPEEATEPIQLYASNPDVLTINFCDIQNDWPGIENIEVDPSFYKYLDETGTLLEHDYKLNTYSPCINAGNPDYVNDNDQKDLDGNNRLAYCRVDIGAYEPPTLSTTDLTNVVNNDTQNTWYCTIQAALDEAEDADEIIVSKGPYNENIIISKKNIILRGTDPSDPDTVDDTIISGVITSAPDPEYPYASTISLETNKAAGVTVKGLTIINGIGYLDDGNIHEDPNYLKGGGLFSSYNDDISIANCKVTANSADFGGGIAMQNCNDAIVTSCRIVNNTCAGDAPYAGGIFIIDCNDVIIDNSIIADNVADNGTIGSAGGIYAAANNRLALNFCTITSNTARQSGGGLELLDCQATAINNTIVYANTPDQIIALPLEESSVNYCDIQNGWTGSGNYNISADPVFVDPANGDYHLSDTSPCLNAGDPNYVYTSGTDFDIDSQPRLAYYRVDIGADEADDVDFKYLGNLVQLKHTTAGGSTTTAWYTAIQDALDDAVDNDEVTVTKGRYLENVIIDCDGILLTGTAPDNPATVINTVIDGSNPSDPDAATVVTLKTDAADDTTVTGLTIASGSGTLDSDEVIKGGGLLSIGNDRVTISNCHIIGNYADTGAGIHLAQADTQTDPNTNCLIDRCNISGNKAAQSGGAIEIYYCVDFVLSHNVITGNTQPDGTISARYISNAKIDHCTIADNKADNSGGGLKLWEFYSDLAITNTIFWDNLPDQIVNDGVYQSPTVTYSDVQNLPYPYDQEASNLNANPLFAQPGIWDEGLWLQGDYHLQSQSGCWTPSYNRHDITSDDIVNMFDFAMISKQWQQSGVYLQADIDIDGIVDLTDLLILTDLFLTKIAKSYDITSDGIINLYDFVALSNQWQQSGDDLQADIEPDGIVDLKDLLILAESFLNSGTGSWMLDGQTSPCINTGKDGVNMGAYGDTNQASKSP